MSDTIIARLDARIAMEPALSDIDSLFVDLKDARASILAGDAALGAATAIVPAINPLAADLEAAQAQISALSAKIKLMVDPPKDTAGLRTDGPTLAQWIADGYTADNYPPAGYAVKDEVESQSTVPSAIIDEVHTLLKEAQERFSVNSMGSVSTKINSALKLLESE